MRTRYEQLIGRKEIEYPGKFDTTDLAMQFIQPFNEGARIEVTTTYPSGETYVRRGTVGITTGWRPTFLLMHRRTDRGSSDVLGAKDSWKPIPRHK